MKESQVSDQIIMRWLPVVDAQGRTRMEAVWITESAALGHAHTTHAA